MQLVLYSRFDLALHLTKKGSLLSSLIKKVLTAQLYPKKSSFKIGCFIFSDISTPYGLFNAKMIPLKMFDYKSTIFNILLQ